MKKGKHIEKTKTIEIYILLLFIATLFINIGYANIVDQEMKVTGTTIAYAQEGVYITDVEYVTDTNADTTNSKINYFLGTMLESKVVLGNSSSTITYKVTIYNSTDKEQIFIGVLTDKTDELQYSNTNIGYSVASAGNITGLEQYVTIVEPGEKLTFPVTFSYEGTDTSNNTLVSKLNFRFKEKPEIELSNEGETYKLERIYAGYTPAEYEFAVTNYNETKVNIVPMTYTIETTINSPLQAKIYDEKGNEVTGSISLGVETQETHNYILKIIWEEGITYDEETALCTVKIKAKPTEEKYLEYEIEKEFNVDITRNRIPTLTVEITDLTETTAKIKAIGEDADGDTLEYTLKIDGEIYEKGKNNTWELTGLKSYNTYTYTVIVSDGIEEIVETETIVEQVTDTAPGVLEGTGTESDPYVINSIEDLVVFAYSVRAGETNYSGKTIELGVSLDFNSARSYVEAYRTDYGEYGYNGELKTLLTNGTGFLPIGYIYSDATENQKFYGTFNANGKFVSNWYYNITSTDYIGIRMGLFTNNKRNN